MVVFVLVWRTAITTGVNQSVGHADPLKKGKVNINTCSKRELVKKVPGMTPSKAQKIIKGRPYLRIYELVSRKCLPRRN